LDLTQRRDTLHTSSGPRSSFLTYLRRVHSSNAVITQTLKAARDLDWSAFFQTVYSMGGFDAVISSSQTISVLRYVGTISGIWLLDLLDNKKLFPEKISRNCIGTY
jgi:hypothetical protein